MVLEHPDKKAQYEYHESGFEIPAYNGRYGGLPILCILMGWEYLSQAIPYHFHCWETFHALGRVVYPAA